MLAKMVRSKNEIYINVKLLERPMETNIAFLVYYKNFMLDLTNYRYEAQKGVIIAYKVDDEFINKNIVKNLR